MKLLLISTILLTPPTAIAAPASSAALTEIQQDLLTISQRLTAFSKAGVAFRVNGTGNTSGSKDESARIWMAQTQLLLGDEARALTLIDEATGSGVLNSALHLRALKVRYEALRMLDRKQEAASTCVQFLELKARDDLWALSCAQIAAHLAKTQDSRKQAANLLSTFPEEHIFRADNPWAGATGITMAAAFERLEERVRARNLLRRVENKIPSSSTWHNRVVLVKKLFDLHLSESPSALKTILELTQGGTDAPVSRRTAWLAHTSLARFFLSQAKQKAAGNHYATAVAMARAHPSQPSTAASPLGVIRNANPLRILEEQPLPEEELRQEYAGFLCSTGASDACAREFDSLSDTLPPLTIATTLTRSRALRSQGIQRLTRLAGFAQSDIAFVEHQLELPVPLSLEELTGRANALVTIAGNYGLNTDGSKALAQLARLPREMAKSHRESVASLAQALAPAEDLLEESPGSASQIALRHLDSIKNDLLKSITELDDFSFNSWKDNQSSSVSIGTRQALLARFSAFGDELSLRSAAVETAPARNAMVSATTAMGLQTAALNVSTARLGSARLLLKLLSSDAKERWWRDAQREITDAQNGLSQLSAQERSATLEFRLAILQSELTSPAALLRRKTLPRIETTVRELSDLHIRKLRSDANSSTLLQLWRSALNAVKSLALAVEETERENQASKRKVTGEAQLILREINALDRASLLLQEKLRKELQQMVPLVAAALEPVTQSFRDQVRLAIVSSDTEVLKENSEARQALSQAAEERRKWIETLHETLRWGMAR